MRFIRALHTYYGLALFCILFLAFFPLFLIPILFPKQFQLVGIINRVWAYIFFPLTFVPYRVEKRAKFSNDQQYIFCPNHFSYLDIATMGLNPVNSIFVGKNDMEKIPLFGFMYRKLHITVDRSKLKSRVNTMLASRQAIEEGKSLVIFPEGGILTKHPPHMHAFKRGAFRTAIEKQIPIVPVTIPYNWIILPDQVPLRVHRSKMVVIFHEPINTKDYSIEQVDELKSRVYQVIDSELKKHANR